MSDVTSALRVGALNSDRVAQPPVFSADPGDESVKRWGPVLSVFGDELDRVIADATAAAPEAGNLADDAYAAARRYGALLEVMCNSADGAKRPCTVYNCCDGISVLLLPQRATSLQESDEALETFESEKTTLNEGVFVALLSKGIRAYFHKNVVDAAGIVTVSVGAGDYCFMRAAERDGILQKLQIAASADAY